MPDPVYRRIRTPISDRGALIDPSLAALPHVIQRNRELAMEFDRRAGFPTGFRAAARQWLVARLGGEASTSDIPLILSGHQPELFHPGVWFKNFLLSSIAQSVAGLGVNLVIDNDAIHSPGIRVPTKADSSPEVVVVPFDAPSEELPWEQRTLLDRQTFKNFSAAVKQAFAPFSSTTDFADGMILDRLWPYAVAAATVDQTGTTSNLGDCLARGRHRLEQELGLESSELRLSAVASGEHFLIFVSQLIERHEEFHAAHNVALAEYRLTNRIRSHTHPVPELTREGDWHELPLWLWTTDHPRRRAVFVRGRGNSWDLTDRLGVKVRVAGSDILEITRFSQLLSGRGIKLRPRALVTTLYARLVLSDLFIHGIGGAKYDELTDAIIRRFFRIEPPAYLTATATFRLPIARPHVSLSDVQHCAQRIRDLRYRPESFVHGPLVINETHLASQVAALAAEKREYLAAHDMRRCSPQVFARLDALNRAMHALLEPLEQQLRAKHVELISLVRQTQLLGSREFSFVLFPAEKLPAQLLALSKVIS